MKECKVCKTQASDDTIFCKVCGTKLPDATPIHNPTLINEKKANDMDACSNQMAEILELLRQMKKPKHFDYLILNSSRLEAKLKADHPDLFPNDNNDYETRNKARQNYLKLAEEYIKSLGRQGWELVEYDRGNDEYFQYIFKREIVE